MPSDAICVVWESFLYALIKCCWIKLNGIHSRSAFPCMCQDKRKIVKWIVQQFTLQHYKTIFIENIFWAEHLHSGYDSRDGCQKTHTNTHKTNRKKNGLHNPSISGSLCMVDVHMVKADKERNLIRAKVKFFCNAISPFFFFLSLSSYSFNIHTSHIHKYRHIHTHIIRFSHQIVCS